MNGRERKREEPVITIGVTDLRPPLFVGMRVSFVPDTLTFSRKHSCLHSCSLGRDTHYSPLLPFVPPSSFLASTIFPPLNVIRAPLNARTHTHTCVHTYLDVRAYPGRDGSNAPLCVQTRMRVRLEPRRWTTPSRFLSLALFSLSSLLPVLRSCPPLAVSPDSLCSGAHVA